MANNRRLADLNVLQQVGIRSRTPSIREGGSRGKRPMLHGWVYDISNELIHSVVEQVDSEAKAEELLPHN
jgi:carbonic anhydrase